MVVAGLLVLFASSTLPDATIGAGTFDATGVTRIIFASCKDGAAGSATYVGNNVSFDWSLVSNRQPHAFIWAGDAIYADHLPPHRTLWWPLRLLLPDLPVQVGGSASRGADPDELQAGYASLLAEPGYIALRSSVAAVLGTWDDHDYGLDNADRTFPHRDTSKRHFLDFLGAPAKDARRRRRGAGVWGATVLGEGARSVMVVALDLRYHRDPYGLEGGDILGEEQWEWLESLLFSSTARAHVLVSSLQLLPTGRERLSEGWPRFPAARRRLLRLLVDAQVRAPVVVSGDVHFAELMAARCEGGGTLVELTSSGLTHSWWKGMGFLPFETKLYMRAAAVLAFLLVPWRYRLCRPGWLGGAMLDLGETFGELEIDWGHGNLTTRALRAGDGSVAFQETWRLSQLDMHGGGGAGRSDGGVPCQPYRGEPPVILVAAGYALAAVLVLALVFVPKPALAFGLVAMGRRAWRHRRGRTAQMGGKLD